MNFLGKKESFPSSFITGLKQLKVIEYYDGPLLIEFEDNDKNNYLATWVDRIEDKDRYLFFRIEGHFIKKYLKCEISLRWLIFSHLDNLYIVDDIEKFTEIYSVSLELLPSDYLPGTDSHFNPELIR